MFYNQGEWRVRGFNEAQQQVEEFNQSGDANPRQGTISLWGRVFNYTEQGYVLDEEYGNVGRIVAND